MSEIVIIGCKLPNGLILEVGLQTQEKDANGKTIACYRKTEAYESCTLEGWNAHTKEQRKAGLVVPAGLNMSRPFLNRIPKTFWERWKKEHPRSWLLKNEILFEAADEASAAMRVAEGAKTPDVLAPLDSTKMAIPGISPADFQPKATAPKTAVGA